MPNPQHAQVTADYTRSREDPIMCSAGDSLSVGERYDWHGAVWVWCTNRAGKSGWMPEGYVTIEGEHGIAKVDYNAIELTVKVGDVVTVLDQSHQWAWCKTADGELGWVPLENIDLV